MIALRLHEISGCGRTYFHWYYDMLLPNLLLKENNSNLKFRSKILQSVSSDVT